MDPGIRAALENCDLTVARFQESAVIRARSPHLADQDDWARAEGSEAGLDLVHRDADGSGDMAGREFRRGADVDELGIGGLQVGYGYGWNKVAPIREERSGAEKDSGARILFSVYTG